MKRYERYKDSGIEWIGEIPEMWRIKKIKHTTYVKGRIGWQGLRSDEFLELSDSLVVTGTDIKNKAVDWGSCYQIPIERYNEDPYIQLKENDLLITKDGTIGKVALVKNMPKIATLNSGIFVIRPSSNDYYITEFMFWILNSNVFSSFFNYNKSGSTIQHLYQNVFNEFQFVCPNLEEQVSISTYLNKLVSETDSLISKKKKLISLLKEERTAIINKAVTKGIDPDMKYKDSGIEWIGEIPEHWNVKRLRTISKEIKTGSTPPSDEAKYFTPEEIDWFGPGDFDSLVLKKAKRKISKLAISDKKCRLFPARTILLIGIGATVGKVGISLGACSSNQQINAIILKENFNPFFCTYYLSSIRELIINEASSATLPIFNQTQTKNLVLAIPSLEEQTRIVSFIDTKTSEIDTIITKTEKEIALIKEYKSALISEVVTGKIDVRDAIEQNQDKLQEAHQ